MKCLGITGWDKFMTIKKDVGMLDGYSDIKSSIDKLRNFRNLYEEQEKEFEVKNEDEAVPYTKNDDLMNNIMETAKTQFGARFDGLKMPMLYYPKENDVTLSGVIPSLNNMKFQFRYLEPSDSVFVWSSPLTLNDNSLRLLSKINGVYKNWKNELNTSEDIKPMSLKK